MHKSYYKTNVVQTVGELVKLLIEHNQSKRLVSDLVSDFMLQALSEISLSVEFTVLRP